ncbi:MAG TPA: VOC family protein [Bryobacteraceae bacterium]|nr:VOC family protein [Bryobacteraceae bacterium]
MKITAILFVDAIEPCLKFWVDALGFTKTVEVPDGDRLGFVILNQGGGEVMLQTHRSAHADVGDAAHHTKENSSHLFIEVEDFDDVLRRTAAFEVVMPIRETFYGMKEILLKEPGGHYVCFAARVTQA